MCSSCCISSGCTNFFIRTPSFVRYRFVRCFVNHCFSALVKDVSVFDSSLSSRMSSVIAVFMALSAMSRFCSSLSLFGLYPGLSRINATSLKLSSLIRFSSLRKSRCRVFSSISSWNPISDEILTSSFSNCFRDSPARNWRSVDRGRSERVSSSIYKLVVFDSASAFMWFSRSRCSIFILKQLNRQIHLHASGLFERFIDMSHINALLSTRNVKTRPRR